MYIYDKFPLLCFSVEVIGVSEFQKRRSTSLTLPKPQRTSSVNTADYTGGSCAGGEGTGEYTGDSGFGDVRPFLKVKDASSQRTAPIPKPRSSGAIRSSVSGREYYKTLGTLPFSEEYTTVTRNSSADQAGRYATQ